MLGIYNQVQGWRSSTGSVLQSGSLAIVSYLVHRMVQMWWQEEQRRGGSPGTWGLGVLRFQIGSLRCQVRPHREENINVDSVREGALSGDGLSRIDTTAEMLTALSEKQQEDENGWRREGGENCGNWHFRAQPHHSTWIIAIVGAWRMQTALGGGLTLGSVLRCLEEWKSTAGKPRGEMRWSHGCIWWGWEGIKSDSEFIFSFRFSKQDFSV